MSKSWQPYAQHILDAVGKMGDIDPLTVQGVVEQHLDHLEHAIRSMLIDGGNDRDGE